MKILNLIIFALLHLLTASTPTNITCDYELHHYDVVGMIYQCDVIGYLSIETKDQATIGSASQDHNYGNNDDVSGLTVNSKSIKYFPIGLEKIFKNLKLIHAQNSFIQEIEQGDLKPFPELKELNFHNNEIQMIEDGLFEYNPKLIYVSFSNNKIFYIQPEVFDGLSNLVYLYLNSNSCIDKGAYLSRSEVLNVIEYVKNGCLGTEYKEMEKKLGKLELDSANLQQKELNNKIEIFEAEFNRSSVSNLTSLRERLERLKVTKPEEIISLEARFDDDDERSSGIAYKVIFVLVIAISVVIFGSVAFLFIKRN